MCVVLLQMYASILHFALWYNIKNVDTYIFLFLGLNWMWNIQLHREIREEKYKSPCLRFRHKAVPISLLRRTRWWVMMVIIGCNFAPKRCKCVDLFRPPTLTGGHFYIIRIELLLLRIFLSGVFGVGRTRHCSHIRFSSGESKIQYIPLSGGVVL